MVYHVELIGTDETLPSLGYCRLLSPYLQTGDPPDSIRSVPQNEKMILNDEYEPLG